MYFVKGIAIIKFSFLGRQINIWNVSKKNKYFSNQPNFLTLRNFSRLQEVAADYIHFTGLQYKYAFAKNGFHAPVKHRAQSHPVHVGIETVSSEFTLSYIGFPQLLVVDLSALTTNVLATGSLSAAENSGFGMAEDSCSKFIKLVLLEAWLLFLFSL